MAEKDNLRILWVKVGGLWPINTGGRLRSFHILSELSRRHELSVMTTHLAHEDPNELVQQLPQCKRVTSQPYAAPKRNSKEFLLALFRSWFTSLPVDLYKFRIASLREEVSKALDSGQFDLCIADFLVAVPNVPLNGSVPVVFFSHNVEHMIWKRICANDSNLLRRSVLEVEWRKMRRYESAVCDSAGLTIAVSEEDRASLHTIAPDSRIASVPTGVDIEYFKPAQEGKEEEGKEEALELVFTGSMDWQPNEDAMFYFIDAILPLIHQQIPGVTLTIVGRNPSPRLQRVATEAGVRVTGTVEDIRPYVDSAAVYIVPLRIGGGTRLKIFEALAMGKAIVSTTIGAEGLPLEEGVHILRADDPATFAARVISLIRDKEQRQRLGQAGRRLVEEHYSWSRVTDEFEDRCRQAIQQVRH